MALKEKGREGLGDWSAEELKAVVYASEVEEAIPKVYQSSDPLDSKDFEPIEYINQLFPSEQSLAGVDDTVTRMRVKLRSLDEEIRSVVREQAESGHDGRQALEEAQMAIQELFGRIRNIKGKAEQSEMMVKKITSDIKQLDVAKKHLTDSIRTLERLRLLIANLEEIDHNSRMRQYGQVATQLKGAEGVVEEFTKYESIPQIKYLISRLSSMKYDLAGQIKVDFEKAFSIRGTPGGAKGELHDACMVVDVLGDTPKNDLIQWFIKMQLSDYEMLFHESLDPSWLDKVDRRYSWLKRTLVHYEEESATIFPVEWAMPERICVEFCRRTKKGLTTVMKAKAADLDVKLLLYAIQKTTAFEKFLAMRFMNSAFMEKLMSKKHKKKQEQQEAEGVSHYRSSQDSSPFQGMISRCFEPHLNVYIESQDRNLSELLEKCVAALKSYQPGVGGSTTVFPSAADLFVFYKKCLVQCASLSTGSPLLELTEVFKRYLQEYGNRILNSSMPKLSGPAGMGAKLTLAALRREATEVRLTPEELSMTCSILCTADYCQDTTLQLESKLKEKIDEQLSDKIDFSQESDMFRDITSSCVQLLVQDCESACVTSFNAMVKIAWQQIEVVGDQSQYVSQVAAHLRTNIPIIRESLSSARKYFINFCHKFANAFVKAFVSYLYKCKPISTIAAEQLLLDTHSLKTCLLELPSIGAVVTRKAPASYSKLVNQGMEKAELIVKMVMSPHDQAEEFLSHYFSIMQGDYDTSNFQKILEMKGLKRSEQHALVDLFKANTAKLEGQGAEGKEPSARGGRGEGGLKGIRKLELMEKLMRTRSSWTEPRGEEK